MPDETTYYTDTKGIHVTDKRVIVRNKTYATANIASIATEVEPAEVGAPLFVIVLGTFVSIGGLATRLTYALLFGLAILAVGIAWYRDCKPTWHLRIASTSGESTPLKSVDKKWVEAIAHAINEAIIHRA